MRKELEEILGRLTAQTDEVLSLDHIGEVIGAAFIAPDEIAELLEELERAGKKIGKPTLKLRKHLRVVLEQARQLKREQQTTPNVTSIATATGLSVAEVRAALLYASVMGR